MSATTTLVIPAAPYRRQTPTIWRCIGRAVWRTLEGVGQRRAAREMRALARAAEATDPARAEMLRIASHFGSMT
jgi:hypothetical protein